MMTGVYYIDFISGALFGVVPFIFLFAFFK